MMNVGCVRVSVGDRGVAMPMGVRLPDDGQIVMLVLMVHVVNMEMIVGEGVVGMLMNVGSRKHHP